jgi:hypothetical protein
MDKDAMRRAEFTMEQMFKQMDALLDEIEAIPASERTDERWHKLDERYSALLDRAHSIGLRALSGKTQAPHLDVVDDGK